MSKHDEARRAFLKSAALGAGAVAGVGLVPEVLAQTHQQHKDAPVTTAQAHAHGAGHGAFLNDDDAATIAAFVERLMPGAPGKPGAGDAGVLNYIDLALAGAYADQQDFYRRGLTALDGFCRKTYGKPFAQLGAAQQDEVIAALEQGKAGGFTWPRRRPSSTRCAPTRWKACSPTRSTAAIRTSPDGASSASPAGNRCSRPRIWRARRPSPASRLSVCRGGRNDGDRKD